MRSCAGRTRSFASVVRTAPRLQRVPARAQPGLPDAGEREGPAVPEREVERLLAPADFGPLVEPVGRDQAAGAPQRHAEGRLLHRRPGTGVDEAVADFWRPV